MDQELVAYFDERFRGIDERFRTIDERFRETWQHMDAGFERVHEEIRHTRIEVEDLRRHTGLLAEGVVNMNEKLDRFQEDVKQRFDEPHSFIRPRTRLWRAGFIPWKSGERRKSGIPSRSSASI